MRAAVASITASERLHWPRPPRWRVFVPNRSAQRRPKFHSDRFAYFRHSFLPEGDRAVSLGSRALKILIVLLEHPASAGRASLP